jgi:hypothetical protein
LRPEAAVLVRAAKPVASVDGYEIRFVGSERYRVQYKIVEDRSFSLEIVGRRSRGATRTSAPPVLQQLVTGGDRQKRIVRFARSNILIHDGHVIDLYRLIRRAVSHGVQKQSEKAQILNLLGPPPKFRADQAGLSTRTSVLTCSV